VVLLLQSAVLAATLQSRDASFLGSALRLSHARLKVPSTKAFLKFFRGSSSADQGLQLDALLLLLLPSFHDELVAFYRKEWKSLVERHGDSEMRAIDSVLTGGIEALTGIFEAASAVHLNAAEVRVALERVLPRLRDSLESRWKSESDAQRAR